MTKKLLIERQIETLAKKLNNFTLSDVEILVEKPKMDIIPMLEQMVNKGRLKCENEVYTYVPKELKCTNKKHSGSTDINSTIHSLPFKPFKPKETFVRNINELDGFVDYFFATPPIKERIKKMFKILKDSHGMKGTKLKTFLAENKISMERYLKYKREISENGLVNLVGSSTREPGEIYYFFKEYYLSPKQLSIVDAKELAIRRFERLIKMRINRNRVTNAKVMLRWVQQEYTPEQIEKFRNINFSEFDTEKMFQE